MALDTALPGCRPHKYRMRKWINIVGESIDPLNETRMTDGCWTGLTTRQMCELTHKSDLRGIGYDNRVYMWPASQEVHLRKRIELGIPSWKGFNFYTATAATAYEYEDGEEDTTLAGRIDWVADGARPTFRIEDIHVYVEQDSRDDCLLNRGFARMVGQKDSLTESAIPESDYGYWIKPDGTFIPVRDRDPIHIRVWMKLTGDTRNLYSIPLSDGWVRVVFQRGELSIETWEKRLTSRSLRSLVKLSHLPEARRFFLDIRQEDGTTVYKNADSARSFVAMLQREINTHTK